MKNLTEGRFVFKFTDKLTNSECWLYDLAWGGEGGKLEVIDARDKTRKRQGLGFANTYRIDPVDYYCELIETDVPHWDVQESEGE